MRKYAQVFDAGEVIWHQFPKELIKLSRLVRLVFHAFAKFNGVAIGE